MPTVTIAGSPDFMWLADTTMIAIKFNKKLFS